MIALAATALIRRLVVAEPTARFATEFIRPEPIVWGGLTGYQLAALAFAPLFALFWWRDSRTAQVPDPT